METNAQLLFNKFLNNQCSPEEVEQLIRLLSANDEDSVYKDMVLAQLVNPVKEEAISQQLQDRLDMRLQQILAADKPIVQMHPAGRKPNYLRYAAAAVVLLCLSFGAYLLLKPQPKSMLAMQHDRRPGGNVAYLTLANGKRITLTGAKNGNLAQQGTVNIHKDKDGLLTYQEGTAENANAMNTMNTPRGGFYTLKLADGTEAMLDATSSITYPVAFSGQKRQVSVTGQVYFKVKHDAARPFIVKVNNQIIEDIGTEFNINGYTDETDTKTTLISGSIKIGETLLKPGQQFDGRHLKTVDTDEVTAWTQGNFQFNDENIESVMRKVARWYDVDVVYQGSAGMTGFGGTVSRSKNLSAVLKVLESTGAVHFKIDGRRVTVMP